MILKNQDFAENQHSGMSTSIRHPLFSLALPALLLGLSSLALLDASAQIAPGDAGWPDAYPNWWYNEADPANGVIDATKPVLNQDNDAPLVLGQLKHIASEARDELDAAFASEGGAGTVIDTLVDGFTVNDSSNLSPANIGQLKNMSSQFFDRFAEVGFTPASAGWPANLILDEGSGDNALNYPWLDNITPANASPANIGQAKHLFSWDLNLGPSILTVNNGILTVDAGQLATNLGTYSNFGAGAISFAASIGTVQYYPGNTWSWYYDTTVGINDSQTVSITTTGANGESTSISFDLVVVLPDLNFDPDSDGDGMPDWWELQHGLNPNNSWDYLGNEDGDGLTNLDEYRLNLDPNDSANPDIDTDGDAIPDSIELEYSLNPNDASDAFEDADGDRYPNVFEIYTQRNPVDSSSYPSYGDLAYYQVDETLSENSGNRYTNIVDAENDADHYRYAIIEVLPGAYEGNLDISKPILILSRDGAEVTSVYDPNIEAIRIRYSSVVLDGLSLTQSAQGLSISGSSNYDVIVKNCIIRDNGSATEPYRGAGIFLLSSNLTIDQSYIYRNTCSADGAGIYQGSGELKMTRTVIMENTAGDDGGGIYAHSGNQTVIHSTIANNIALGDYDGIYINNSSDQYNYINSLIWNPKDIVDWSSHIHLPTGLSESGVFTNCLTPDTSGNLQVDNSLLSPVKTDPLLTVDGHLLYNSPAIDRVPASSVVQDMDDEDYPSTNSDIGADEYTDTNGTTDGDGLPDWVEALGVIGNFTADHDSDGLTNGEEYTLGSPITDADIDGDGLLDGDELYGDGSHGDTDGYVTNVRFFDSDRDGMPDGWEVANGLNPTDDTDAFEDIDGDRYPNIWEYTHGFQATVFGIAPDPMNPVVDAPAFVWVDPLTGENSTTDLIYSTIQEALNAVNFGFGSALSSDYVIVQIASGTYDEYSLELRNQKFLLLGELGASTGPVVINSLGPNGGSLDISESAVIDGLVVTHDGVQDGPGVSISIDNESARVRLINCIVRGNTTSGSGGGVENDNAGLTELIHCTFVGNRAEDEGSSIYNDGSQIHIVNSILWDEVDLTGTDSALADESIDGRNSGAGVVVVDSIVRGGDFMGIDEDPELTVEGWLQSTSPAINRSGVSLYPVSQIDLNGEVRSSVGMPDLGADEFINSDVALGDTLPDWFELRYGGAVNSIFVDTGHGDADSLTNLEEYLIGTNPIDSDTDGDTLLDDDELTDQPAEGDTDGKITSPLNPDDDFDGMPTLWEIEQNTSTGLDAGVSLLDYSIDDGDLNNDGDLNHDGILENEEDTLTNLEEYLVGTHPLKVDSDGDGLPDSWELDYGLNPSSLENQGDASLDEDGDSLTNAQEYSYGTDPNKSDTDGDYIDDGAEIAQGSDPLDQTSLGDYVNLPVLFDFEGSVLADLNTQDGWEAAGASVIQDPNDASNQLIELVDDDSLNYLLHPIAPSNDGREVFINFDAKLQPGELFSTATLTGVARSTILLSLDPSGQLAVYDGGAEAWLIDLDSGISYADTWHHYEIKLNTFKANWSLSVGGIPVFENVPVRDADSYAYYFWSFYYKGESGTAGAPVLIDNVTLSYDPNTDFYPEFELPLQEGFTSYSNSDLISASENTEWKLLGAGASAIINSEAPSASYTDFDEDGVSLQLSAGAEEAILSHSFEAQSGYVTARFAIQPSLLTSSEVPVAPSADIPVDFYFDASGTLHLSDGSDWLEVDDLLFASSTWYTMTIVYDIAAQTWRLDVNDQTVATDLLFADISSEVDTFTLINRSSTMMVIDKISVTTGAPPLISLGSTSTQTITGQSFYIADDPNSIRLRVTAYDVDTNESLTVDFYDSATDTLLASDSTEPYSHYTSFSGDTAIYAVATDSDGLYVISQTLLLDVSADSENGGNGNGLPDAWEFEYFGSNGQDASADPDGDGHSNADELLNGSNPTDYYNFGHATLEVVPQITITEGDGQTVLGAASGDIKIRITDQEGSPLVGAPFTIDTNAAGLLFDWDADPSDGAKPLSGFTGPNGTATFVFQP